MRHEVIVRCIACAACWLAVAGCAVNRDYAAAGKPPFGLAPPGEIQFDDAAIARAFALQSQLRTPASVAVYQRAAECREYDIRENEDVEALSQALKGAAGVDEVHVLSRAMLPGQVSVESARMVAARHHADLTLLLDTDFRTKVRPTPLVLLNLAIVPAYVLPSATVELETRVRAYLVDTRNGHIYYSTQNTREWSRFMPIARSRAAVLENRRRLIEESCREISAEIDARIARAALAPPARPRRIVVEVRDPAAAASPPTPDGSRYETPVRR